MPATGVLVLSQYLEDEYALQLLGDDAAGVGYLLKDRVSDFEHFTEAVLVRSFAARSVSHSLT
jgi:hypothetical protein